MGYEDTMTPDQRLEAYRRKRRLVKIDDESADGRRRPTSTQNESVLTGRTNADLDAD
jgi:hypothetical protein